MRYTLGTLALVALMVASGSLFVVHETQRAMVLRLGKITNDAQGEPKVLGPGLHLKMPFADSVRWLDIRLQTLDIQSSRMLTQEKKDVIVDLFVKWRISDLRTYFTRTGGDKRKAERLLQEQVIDGIRAEFGRRTIQDVVSGERQVVMNKVKADTALSAKGLGIEVIDTRVKRIDFPTEVSEKVYDRMRTERMRVASEHRAQGRSKAEMIHAEADAKATIMVATAEQEAQILRGAGDAQATALYAEAYGQAPELYRFEKSLEAYSRAFASGNDTLILSPDSEFFRFWSGHPPEGS